MSDITDLIVSSIPQPIWGSWYIKEKLGSGAFSAVYRVEAVRTNRVDVSALKIQPITAGDTLFADQQRKMSYIENKKKYVESESTIMYNLRSCPNIVAYEEEYLQEFYVDGQFEGYYFLIRMELLTSLTSLIRQGKMDLSEASVINLARQIGNGIKAAHDIGVIHRDIKPDNFFIDGKGVYKLGDFNVSKQADSTKTIAGTFGYIAPEVYRTKSAIDEGYTAHADIYSFGICLYQLMNNLYFPLEESGNTEDAIARRMRGEELPPPVNASPGFSQLILKACAFDPNQRYSTIDELLSDLEWLTIMGQSSASVTGVKNHHDYQTAKNAAAVPRIKGNNKKRTVLIIALLCTLVILIAAVSGIFIFGGKKKGTSGVPSPPYLTLKEDRLFVAETGMLGMTYDELNDLFGYTLTSAEASPKYREEYKLSTVNYQNTHYQLLFRDNCLTAVCVCTGNSTIDATFSRACKLYREKDKDGDKIITVNNSCKYRIYEEYNVVTQQTYCYQWYFTNDFSF